MNVAEALPLYPKKPNALRVNYEGIPEKLKEIPHWVLWRYIHDSKTHKWNKVPYQPCGEKASRITQTPGPVMKPSSMPTWMEALMEWGLS